MPITALILLFVFGAPLAAVLPVLLALASTSIGLAGLYLLSAHFAVSVFAQNVVSMIGLGVGVDYALFVLSRYREARARGLDATAAAREARDAAGHSVLLSGVTVAVGFLALFLVHAPFLHAIAIGGVLVVAAAVAAAMTLLPSLLVLSGPALDWPRRARPPRPEEPSAFWSRWPDRHATVPGSGSPVARRAGALSRRRCRAWWAGTSALRICRSRPRRARGYDALVERFSRLMGLRRAGDRGPRPAHVAER